MKLLLENWRKFISEQERKTSNDDDDYPSVKKAKRERALGKPDRRSWVAGADELNAIAHGIAEDDTEACGSNPNRNRDGEFSSAGNAAVYTTGYSDDAKRDNCKKQSKWKSSSGNKGSESDKKCGRNPKTGEKYNIRCRDNKKLWGEHMNEDGLITIEPEALEDIVSKLIDREFNQVNHINEGYSPEQVKQFCNKSGYSNTEQFLTRQNAMVASAKGDLLKDKK